MTVELKDLEVGSVVIDIRGSIGIILETNRTPTYPVIFAVKASGSRYKGRPDDFKAVIGKVDIELFKTACGGSTKPYVGTDIDILMPEHLRKMGIKKGDKIKVRHGIIIVEAIFEGYNPRRSKFPVSYTINGEPWKGTAYAVVGKAA